MKMIRNSSLVFLMVVLVSFFFHGCGTEPAVFNGEGEIARANVNLSSYYANAFGKTGTSLRSALKGIIGGHTSISYSKVWTAYKTTDRTSSGKIWDMYADNGTGSLPYYSYNYGSDQCGTYRNEGDCYNREHSWPAKKFYDKAPMYTDLHHLFATDGKVNNMRSSYSFGEVRYSSWTSRNGSKLGAPTIEMGDWGCSESKVFEPIDEFKGDFARAYFYMVTRYQGTSESSPWSSNFTLKPWAIKLLLKWHRDDDVSTKERNRNDAIYVIQKNRNPFIDYPDWVESIWGDGGSGGTTGSTGGSTTSESFSKASYSTSYGNGSFSGDDINWSYTQTKWNMTLDGRAACLGKNRSPYANIKSATVSGGCGTLTFKYKQTYSTRVNFDVYVNSTRVKVVSSGSSGTVSVPVNKSGNVYVKFEQNYGGGQVTIDSVSWTSY